MKRSREEEEEALNAKKDKKEEKEEESEEEEGEEEEEPWSDDDEEWEEDNVPAKVFEGLYLGSEDAARNFDFCKKNGVTHVLVTCAEGEKYFPDVILICINTKGLSISSNLP